MPYLAAYYLNNYFKLRLLVLIDPRLLGLNVQCFLALLELTGLFLPSLCGALVAFMAVGP
jgi:hypothetical protein